jgi:protease-4
MPKEELQQHAQGRVWSGKRALQNGLIDGLGGIDRAIGIAKQAAGIGRRINSACRAQPACHVWKR